MDRFSSFKKTNDTVVKGASLKEVVSSPNLLANKKRSRKTNDINVKNVDQDIFDYVDSTGISMSTFVRMAIREKKDRDSSD